MILRECVVSIKFKSRLIYGLFETLGIMANFNRFKKKCVLAVLLSKHCEIQWDVSLKNCLITLLLSSFGPILKNYPHAMKDKKNSTLAFD
jgi:hypothetical protein